MIVTELASCFGRPQPANERAAIQVCLGCALRAQCLNGAIAQRDISRPRAGLSTTELRLAMGWR